MLKNFNKLIFESLIEKSNYTFYNDENKNIFCTFTVDNEYVVNAKEFNKELTFFVTMKDGNSENMTEKEFSYKFNDAYNKFKKELQKYKNNGLETEKIDENLSKIENFNEQLIDVETNDPNVRLNKDLKLNDRIFNFKILNDLMVENYAQCVFEFYDKKKNQKFGVKSLLFMKLVNSIIVKIILQDEKGQILQNMTENDFKIAYPDELILFKKAISKFEEYLNNIK